MGEVGAIYSSLLPSSVTLIPLFSNDDDDDEDDEDEDDV
jgi:hypothetical protein